MKNLILSLVLIISSLSYSQNTIQKDLDVKKEVRVESVDVVVTVDSATELESSFTIKDIRDMFELSDNNESISFELVCNGDKMSNGKKSYMSYKVEGSSSDQETFVKRVEAIRKAAIKYYNNKN